MTDDHMLESDVDFAVFLATRKPWKVSKERPVRSIRSVLDDRYDRVTDNKLALLRGLVMKEERAV